MNRLVQKIKLKLKLTVVAVLYTVFVSLHTVLSSKILFPFNVNRLPIQASVLGSALEPNLSPYGQDLIYLGISAFLICNNALCGANEDNPVSTNKLSQCYYEDKREECYHSIIGPRPILGLHLERKICIN